MNNEKKPAVKAKTARRVHISATEAKFAELQGMSLKQLAESKLPKRGRPKGSKNKAKHLGDLPVGTTLTADQLFDRIKNMKPVSSDGWVPPFVDWESLAKRLQEALATEMKITEKYEKAGFFDRLTFLFTGKL